MNKSNSNNTNGTHGHTHGHTENHTNFGGSEVQMPSDDGPYSGAHTEHEIPEQVKDLFKKASDISLTFDEKIGGSKMFEELMAKDIHANGTNNAHGANSIRGIIRSPYSIFAYFRTNRVAVFVATAVFIFSFMTGTTYAASKSLPGDLLYPIKLGVNEKVELALALNTESKARIAVRHALNRVEEVAMKNGTEAESRTKTAMTMSAVDTTSDTNTETSSHSDAGLYRQLAKNADEVENLIAKLKAEGKVEVAIAISSQYEDAMTEAGKKITGDIDFKTHVQGRIAASIARRTDIENTLTDSNTIIKNRNVALKQLVTSEEKIKRTENLVDSAISYGVEVKDESEIKKQLNNAKNALVKGKEKFSVGAYGNAFTIFKNAGDNVEYIEEGIKTFHKNSKSSVAVGNSNTGTTSGMTAAAATILPVLSPASGTNSTTTSAASATASITSPLNTTINITSTTTNSSSQTPTNTPPPSTLTNTIVPAVTDTVTAPVSATASVPSISSPSTGGII